MNKYCVWADTLRQTEVPYATSSSESRRQRQTAKHTRTLTTVHASNSRCAFKRLPSTPPSRLVPRSNPAKGAFIAETRGGNRLRLKLAGDFAFRKIENNQIREPDGLSAPVLQSKSKQLEVCPRSTLSQCWCSPPVRSTSSPHQGDAGEDGQHSDKCKPAGAYAPLLLNTSLPYSLSSGTQALPDTSQTCIWFGGARTDIPRRPWRGPTRSLFPARWSVVPPASGSRGVPTPAGSPENKCGTEIDPYSAVWRG